MKTNDRSPRIWRRRTVGALALLITLTTGTALAAVPSTTAHHFASHPMISGTVVTVNDRQMVVDTHQGEAIALEMDSRTIAPRDLAPGMNMRAEFLALEDCRFYAQRIMPIRAGMSTDRPQAYANTRDGGEVIVRGKPGLGGHLKENRQSEASVESLESLPRKVGERSLGTRMIAVPNTADYQFSTHPMISGRVISVNDHRVVVETDQGRRVGLVMDSHTIVPSEVEPGTFLRAEFIQMRDGRYYANRISRIGSGVADREQEYERTRDSEFVMAQNPVDCGSMSSATPSKATSAFERRTTVVQPDAVVAQSSSVAVVERPKTLPQTASHQPLVLLLGSFALGSAALVSVVRRCGLPDRASSRSPRGSDVVACLLAP